MELPSRIVSWPRPLNLKHLSLLGMFITYGRKSFIPLAPEAWKSEDTAKVSGRTKPVELKSELSEGEPGTLMSSLSKSINDSCTSGGPR